MQFSQLQIGSIGWFIGNLADCNLKMKLCLFLLFILPWSTVAADKEKVVQDRDNSIVVTSDEIQPSFDGSNVDDDNTKNAATARFFSNGFLEGLSQLILVQGQISSCYSCTSTFPRHSSTCCNQGFSNCCADSGEIATKYLEICTITIPIFYFAEYSKDSSKKPGYCPSIGSGTLNQKTCSHQCHYDADCPADYKCCPYGCSYLCAKSKPGNTILVKLPAGLLEQ